MRRLLFAALVVLAACGNTSHEPTAPTSVAPPPSSSPPPPPPSPPPAASSVASAPPPVASAAPRSAPVGDERCSGSAIDLVALLRARTCIVPVEQVEPLRARDLDVEVEGPAAPALPGAVVDLRITLGNRGAEPLPIAIGVGNGLAGLFGEDATSDPPELEDFRVRTFDAKDRDVAFPPGEGLIAVLGAISRPTSAHRVVVAPGGSAKVTLHWRAIGWPQDRPKPKHAGQEPPPLAPGSYTVKVHVPLVGRGAHDDTSAATRVDVRLGGPVRHPR